MTLQQQADFFVPAKRNPFAVERVTRIPFRFEEGNWMSHLGRLREFEYRAAIVGPQGSGKSTLLKELAVRLDKQTDRDSVYLFIPEDKQESHQLIESALSAEPRHKVILADGIERLSLGQKLALFRGSRHAAGLVVTSHFPLRLPPFRLPTWVKTQTSELVLDYVLAELSMASPEVRAAGQESYREHKGNLRDVLRDLYDRHSAMRFR